MTTYKALLVMFTSLLFLSSAYANDPPVFDLASSSSVAAGQSLSVPVVATDPEGGAVRIMARGLESWMTFSNNTLSLVPGSEHIGTYTVRFLASDRVLRSFAVLDVVVTGAPSGASNQPPVIGDISDQSVRENSTVVIPLVVSDPDGDPVTIDVSPDFSWVNVSGNSVELSPYYSSSGDHTLTFTASDGELSTVTTMQVTVVNIDRAPEFLPVLPSVVPEGGSVEIPITATDPDGDVLTIIASGLSSWMDFDGSILSVAPGFSDAGNYTVNFFASGSELGASMVLDIEVNDSNLGPEWSDVKADWTIGDGTVLSLPVEAIDPDGDLVTVSMSGAPSWVSFDGKVLRARPEVGETGLFSVFLTASDGNSSSLISFSINVQSGEQGFPANWMSYMGSVGEEGADWADWKRYWLVGATGISLVNDPSMVSRLEQAAVSTLATQDLMIPVAGFAKDEGRMADFLDLIHYGGIDAFREAVMSQVNVLSPLDPNAEHVFYQLGNEITTEAMSVNVRNWVATTGFPIPGVAQGYDHETIYYYVEYYLAPIVEAAGWASYEYYGLSDKLNIVLGSIGNGGNPEARAFLDALLGYQIKGKYATSLEGLHVYELIDLISVHYVGASENLDLIWDKWKDVGSIRGLWTTEEIGINSAEGGAGAGRAVTTTARQLEWFYKRQLNPDQSRVAYYAWDIGSADSSVEGVSADESMLVLQDFMGNVPLEVLAGGGVVTGPESNLSVFQYNSLEEDNKRVIVVSADGTESSLVETIHMDSEGWSGTMVATVHHFFANGHVSEDYTLTNSENGYEIVLSTPITIADKADALLITLQKL